MNDIPVSPVPPEMESVREPKKRLLSLDVMRGLTIAAMILVNNNGDPRHAYSSLLHSAWNGCTPTDLIFPAFLFMMGVSMSFSMVPRIRACERPLSFLPGVLRRTGLLILLGLFVNGYPWFHLDTLRYSGVLQRIGLCFLFSSICVLWGNTQTRIAAVCLLLFGYWMLLRYAPVPGYGYPVRDFPLLDHWKTLPAWLDRRLFPGHLYHDGSYDPEGLLSTIPAIADTLGGILVGEWLRYKESPKVKAAYLGAAGVAFTALGYCWSFVLPFNKRLWTSSYALFALGVACVLFVLLYWIIDIQKHDGVWIKPWVVFGTNAITAYIFSELLAPTLQLIRMPDSTNFQHYSMVHVFGHIQNPAVASLAYSISFVLVCYPIVIWLYRRRIFLRL